MDIGERIKDHRTKRGWSQQELADKLNVSRQTVSRWEIGSSIPDVEMMMKISDLFEIDLKQLVSGEVIEDTLRGTISTQSKLKKLLLFLVPLVLILLAATIFFYVQSHRENSYQIETTKLAQISTEIGVVNSELDSLLRNEHILLPYNSAQITDFIELTSRLEGLDKSLDNIDTKLVDEDDLRNIVNRSDGLKRRLNDASSYLEVYQMLMKYFNSDFLNDDGETMSFLDVRKVPNSHEYDELVMEINFLADGSVKNEFQKVLDQLLDYDMTKSSQ